MKNSSKYMLPRYNVKVVISDMNAKFEQEEVYRQIIGKESLYNISNDN